MSELAEPTRAKIQSLVNASKIVLFMKGTRRAPQCGFSASVIELLDAWVDAYETVDVISDPELREGVKQFSDWPTIPQLYVDGEFLGGADILTQLEQSGELGEALGAGPLEPPAVEISELAAAQFRAAMAGDDIDEADVLRLSIDNMFRNDLSVGPHRPNDIVVDCGGLKLAMDRRSARRARGLSIDFVESAAGAGFKIDNPNAPPSVRELSVEQLSERLVAAKSGGGATLHLYDVRTAEERDIAEIVGAVLLDEEVAEEIDALSRDTPLYFHCHHGGRSQRAGQHFIELGFTEVYNVSGGIDAWSQRIDSSVPRY